MELTQDWVKWRLYLILPVRMGRAPPLQSLMFYDYFSSSFKVHTNLSLNILMKWLLLLLSCF
jgi:hypothetical protein